MWAALEEIPDKYREPLILFYRSGQSVRAVADALEVTETCVKQRLSRGRKMLRTQVAAFVEDTLAHTVPTHAFTVAVVAALPVLVSKPVAATTAAVAGKGAGLVGKGTAVGISAGALGGILGGLVAIFPKAKSSVFLFFRMCRCGCLLPLLCVVRSPFFLCFRLSGFAIIIFGKFVVVFPFGVF